MMFIYFSVKNRNLFSFFFVLRQFLVIISNRLSINNDMKLSAVCFNKFAEQAEKSERSMI